MLRTIPDTAPLQLRGTWNLEGAHKPGGLKDKWRALEMGHLSARDSTKGTWRKGFFTGEPKRYVK
jgi:hypothetical protein